MLHHLVDLTRYQGLSMRLSASAGRTCLRSLRPSAPRALSPSCAPCCSSSKKRSSARALTPGAEHLDKLARWLASPPAHTLLSRCIIDFVSTGVSKYCDATIHINPYEQALQAATKPEHLRVLRYLTSTFCHSTVHALAACGSSSGGGGGGGGGRSADDAQNGNTQVVRRRNGVVKGHHEASGANTTSTRRDSAAQEHSGIGWVKQLATVLEHESVRRVCAESARAGSAGAVQAAWEQAAASQLAKPLSDHACRRR